VTSLFDRLLRIEGEASIDFGRHLAGDNLEDLLAELDQKSVECGVHLRINVLALNPPSVSESHYSEMCTYVFLAVLNRRVDQLGIFGLLRGGEDEGWVRGGILRLVFGNSCNRSA
jgi:hypothetical protein